MNITLIYCYLCRIPVADEFEYMLETDDWIQAGRSGYRDEEIKSSEEAGRLQGGAPGSLSSGGDAVDASADGHLSRVDASIRPSGCRDAVSGGEAADVQTHAHFLCETCGKLVDLMEDVGASLEACTSLRGTVNRIEVKLTGECEDCASLDEDELKEA